LHLILDLDKTLIRAFQEGQLASITKQREDYHITRGMALPTTKQKRNVI
jgi:hypothetical protein